MNYETLLAIICALAATGMGILTIVSAVQWSKYYQVHQRNNIFASPATFAFLWVALTLVTEMVAVKAITPAAADWLQILNGRHDARTVEVIAASLVLYLLVLFATAFVLAPRKLEVKSK